MDPALYQFYLDSGLDDLPAAVIAGLRSTPGLIQAFGDSTATPKFHADEDGVSVTPPYATYEELDEDSTFQSADEDGVTVYFDRGQIVLFVIAQGKQQCRELAEMCAAGLNDAPLQFNDGTLLEFRQSSKVSPPVRVIGPQGQPTVYKRSVTFTYMVQRNL